MPDVHLSSTASPGEPLDDLALALLERWRAALATPGGRYRHVADAGGAELIVLVEAPRYKFATHADVLLASEVVRRYAHRCFVYDWADGVAGFLPGVYAAAGRSQWDPARCVPGGYLHPYNTAVIAAAQSAARSTREPRRLLSFRGAISHELRGRIAATRAVTEDPRVEFGSCEQWYTHSAEQQQAYVESILDAKFILCPRGVSPGSFRIYEAMALGRAPVIVSDDWMPPPGPDWGAFSLVIGESRIAELPELVAARESDWQAMGRLARRAWEEYFSIPNALTVTLGSIEQIALARPRGETLGELKARWTSRRFKLEHGWATSQRLGRIVTSPAARERLRQRVTR